VARIKKLKKLRKSCHVTKYIYRDVGTKLSRVHLKKKFLSRFYTKVPFKYGHGQVDRSKRKYGG
jgi:hypothetical protein